MRLPVTFSCEDVILNIRPHYHGTFIHKMQICLDNYSISTNILPPPLYGLRKTHKKEQNGIKGPALRPVCGAKVAPNSRMSSFVSKIIYDVADTINDSRECKSSEEMRASFEAANNSVDENVRKRSHILSMDAKALYPSLRKKVCKNAVKWLVKKGNVSVVNVDWIQVTRYVAVMCTTEEIASEGLTDVIPGRVKMTRRKLTMNSLQVRTADSDWTQSQHPDDDQKRKLLGVVLAVVCILF